jgi:tetratricopeptide (TPR) repeat protein
MVLPRDQHSKTIADQLNLLAAIVKTRSLASLTDANRILETISRRFFNALFGWQLANLNCKLANYPAADLGDGVRRIAIQVTNDGGSSKIRDTAAMALRHHLGKEYDRLIILFLMERKPKFPRKFIQTFKAPIIETWDISDVLKQILEMDDLDAIGQAANILQSEVGNLSHAKTNPRFDISRILSYTPAELIGRDEELKLLNAAWRGNPERLIGTQKLACKPHILTLVAAGGEGKTSLIAKWVVNEFQVKNWLDCEGAFAWSFYSQGTRDQAAATSDLFLKEALMFFGESEDQLFGASSASTYEKGQRLAGVIARRRNLLILDGLEPLQYPPTPPHYGALKDQGLSALLRGLATADSNCLCVTTTRFSLPDVKAFWHTAAPEVELKRLSRDAGVHLLDTLGVHGTASELTCLVEDVKGHALTLALLGSFLKRAFRGDVRKRDRIKFEGADERIDGGHAFRVIAAYEDWLLGGGDEGRREVALLRLMGLFDRPVGADCLQALRRNSIAGLTDELKTMSDEDWEFCLSGIEEARLVSITRDGSGACISVDAHPHLRAYFAKQVKQHHPSAWLMAHRWLFRYFCTCAPNSTKAEERNPLLQALGIAFVRNPTLEDLQPLYQAVAHACYSRLHEKAWTEVFLPRILRGERFYSYQKLGAVSSDLGALSCFFNEKWKTVSALVTASTRGRVLNAAGLRLRMLGRLDESLEAHQEAIKIKQRGDPVTPLRNLSEVQLELGLIKEAVSNSAKCISRADKCNQNMHRFTIRAIHGAALHQAGQIADAKRYFYQAEQIVRTTGDVPCLYSVYGFMYCELLLSVAERFAWRVALGGRAWRRGAHLTDWELRVALRAISATAQRARKTLKIAETYCGPLEIALDHLTLGCAALYRSIISKAMLKGPKGSSQLSQSGEKPALHRNLERARQEIDQAISHLHQAGTIDLLPRALLSRAWLRWLSGLYIGSNSAQADLDEAWEIAERGPMRLHMADIHLYRARLFLKAPAYPWSKNGGVVKGPRGDLGAAEALIHSCGYYRRDKELADAKHAINSSTEV